MLGMNLKALGKGMSIRPGLSSFRCGRVAEYACCDI